jgi:hypothetical protein
MPGERTIALAVAAGAGAAWGVDELFARWLPAVRVRGYAVGLVGAAAIYPALRTAHRGSRRGRRELAATAGYGVLAVLASSTGIGASASRVIAAGWASHALFDLVHATDEHTRLPNWYPAMCAGYDIAAAALLLRPRTEPGPR